MILRIADYGMIPVISAPLHGFDIAGPPIGSFELDTVDIVSSFRLPIIYRNKKGCLGLE